MSRVDVAVLGGALMGSSVAYFLKTLAPGASVRVVEPDPSYEFASTLRASGGVRVLFSCPENIEMSKYGREFIREFPQRMAVDGREAPVDWVRGRIPLHRAAVGDGPARVELRAAARAGLRGRAALARAARRAVSADVRRRPGRRRRTPPRDGWCDPHALLRGFRRKAARWASSTWRTASPDFHASGARVTAATLASGATLEAEVFVNATGAWSAGLRAMVDMPLPVAPLRRFEHYFTAGDAGRAPAVRQGHGPARVPLGGHGLLRRARRQRRAARLQLRRGPRLLRARRLARRRRTASRRSRRRNATGPGPASTSSASSTAIRSSAPGPARWRISTW